MKWNVVLVQFSFHANEMLNVNYQSPKIDLFVPRVIKLECVFGIFLYHLSGRA